MRSISWISVVAVGALALAACSSDDKSSSDSSKTLSPTSSVPLDPSAFAATVNADNVLPHLDRLQEIADRNGGNRAAFTKGYSDSVDYVVAKLNERGFTVTTPEFEVEKFEARTVKLTSAGRDIGVDALTYSQATPAGGLTAKLLALPADETPGCEATDYDGKAVAGSIVLVKRGKCSFKDKEKIAADKGAKAIIVVNNEDGPLNGGTLGGAQGVRLPAVGVSTTDGAALATADTVSLTVDSSIKKDKTRNIIAETNTGSAANVVMVGAHLDSVDDGPGINDNGSGSAAILQTALNLGAQPNITNKVRFAWWGAEELGLDGSEDYVGKLSDADRQNIALYLNFDMIGSPNAGYLAYDGDDSDKEGEGPGPKGSDGIERVLANYMSGKGIKVDGTDFDGRSDYGPFIEHKIPSGGLYTGAEVKMTPEQAGKWGGKADTPFDPNYHAKGDTRANINAKALGVNSGAIAFVTATYARSIDGSDGVPTGPARSDARKSMPPSK